MGHWSERRLDLYFTTYVLVYDSLSSLSLQLLDSSDSQRLLDGMFNKAALSCSLLRLLRSRQVLVMLTFGSVFLMLCYPISYFFFLVNLQMALEKKGIDCSFVNTISKLSSHQLKGMWSVLLHVAVQGFSRQGS